MTPGDVVLIRLGFHQAPGSKVRPVVVVFDSGDSDFVGAPVTSHGPRCEWDIALSEWAAAGLNVASTVRAHKVAVLAKSEVVRAIGTVDAADLTAIQSALCRAYCH